MKPLLLHGHERAITKICYNLEGDLLFSASKDNTPNVWYATNGERLGTFDGHKGTVWCIHPKWDSTLVATGGGDFLIIIWDCETGKLLNKIHLPASVRSVAFSYSGKLLAYATDEQMNQLPEINVIDITSAEQVTGEQKVFNATLPSKNKAVSGLWGILDQTLIFGHENGNLSKWDIRNPSIPNQEKQPHKAQINDLQYNKDMSLFISASKDHTAKLFDPFTLETLKTYVTERPVNSASISPIFDHVVLGGGQEAMDVTRSATESGKFEARFFHLIFEEEFARVKGHFGPIQSLSFHPDGRSFATGGEDGYIRVQSFDDSYYKFKMEYE